MTTTIDAPGTPGAATEPPAPPAHRRRPARPARAEGLDAHHLVRRAAALVPRRPPVLLLAGAMAWWYVTFATLLTWRHDHFGSFDFDLGIWDQATWLLAHGGGLDTVRGLEVFAHHATPALYAYVPFYWLGAGPNFLDVSMVGAVCVGAVPVFRIARHYLHNEWHALVPALAFLVNFAAQWLLQETFHPEVMAIPFLLFAYLAAIEGRWRHYAVWLVLAVMWKEDIALAAVMLGAVLAIRGRNVPDGGRQHALEFVRGPASAIVRLTRLPGGGGPALTRKAGMFTMLGCGLYFLFATQWLIPHFSPAGNFTEGWFGDLGSRTTDIARSLITRPDLVREHLAQSDPRSYFQELGGSFGFVSLLSPLPLLIGFAQTAINLLAVQNFFWPTRVHYAAVPLVAVTIASTEGLARFRQLPVRRFLLAAMAVGAFFTAVSWGISPLSRDFRNGNWPLEPASTQARFDEAVARPGPDDSVSALYLLVPHLTHRFAAYTFPNPWLANNWGVAGENRPDPDTVDWIMVNPGSLGESDRAVLATALTDPGRRLEAGDLPAAPPADQFAELTDTGRWTVVTDDADLFVVHRVRP